MDKEKKIGYTSFHQAGLPDSECGESIPDVRRLLSDIIHFSSTFFLV